MPDVDNLNFSVLINDKDFDAKCQKMEERAQRFNTTIAKAFEIEGMKDAIASMTEYKAVIDELQKKLEEESKKALDYAAQVGELQGKIAAAQKGASESSKAAMTAEAEYLLANAREMEKQNSYRKIGNELVKESAEVSKQLKDDFAYLAEEERKEAEESHRANEDKIRATAQLKTQMREYIALLDKSSKIDSTLKVRQVSNPDATLTANEVNLLAQYTARQKELRAEIDKIIAKYPQLKALFDQTYNTASLHRAVASERELAREAEKVTRERERQNKATNAAIQGTARLTEHAKKLTMETGKVTRYVNQFKNILGGATSIYAIKSILSNMIQITGEFELQRTTLRAILQDANKADVIFEKIKGLALVSPFNFKDLISYTKQLSAFSVPANELYDTTKMLADLSAGLGVEMNRLILAYGQVRSAAFLRGCLGKGTKIKTARGIVNVEDVVVGDVLYNEKNEKVNVLELIRGRENMFLVRQYKGMKYRVNENHILTCFKDGELHDVYVKDWNRSYYGAMVTENGLETYPITIERDGVDDYYGFVLDGNKRFQLGDGTVTHNTEVRQFTEAGVPLLEALKNEFVALGEEGITVGQVFDKISNRQVSFEMVKKVLTDMTEEGGKFYNMQEVQSETLKGKLSNLGDAFQMMFNEIGSSQSDLIKGGIDGLRKLMDNWESVGRTLVQLIATYGAFKVAASVAHIVSLVKAYGSLSNAIKNLTIVQKILNSTLAKNPYVAAATALAFVVGWIIKARINAEALNKELNKIGGSKFFEAEKSVRQFELLAEKLRNSAKGSENYRNAIRKLNNQYGEYLPKLLTEADALETLNGAYQRVTESIYKKAQATAATQGYTKIEEELGEEAERAMSRISSRLLERGINRGQISDIMRLFVREAETALENGVSYDAKKLFEKISSEYLGVKTDFFQQSMILNDPFLASLNSYVKAMQEVKDKKAEFDTYLSARFGQGFNTDKERKQIEDIESWYKKESDALKNTIQSTEQYNESVKNLDISKYEKLRDIYAELGRQDMVNEMQRQIDDLTKIPEEFIRIAREVINSAGLKLKDGIGALYPQDNVGWKDYIASIRDGYKEIKTDIADAGVHNEKNLPTLNKIKKAYEDVAAAIHILLVEQKASTKKEENRYKADIDALKKQYDLIKQMQSAYETLSGAGVSDSAIKTFFKGVMDFGDFDFKSLVNDALSFDGAIKGGLEFEQQIQLITDVLRKMGEEGVKAAENIEQSVKKVDLGEETRKFVELKKRMDEFNKSMKEWMGEDFNLIGEGIILDISRIAAELNTKTDEIKRKADEMRTKYSEIGKDADAEKALGGDVESILKMQDRYGTEVWANYVKHGSAAIDELEKKEIAAAKKVSQEKVNDLAKKYGSEIIGDNSDIKTKRYGNLSIGQISKSIEALNDLLSKTEGELENILPEDLVKQIQEAGLSLTEFVEAYQKYLQNIKKDNEVELFKKVTKSAKETIGYVSSLSQSLARIGNATGNNGLVVAADALERMKELSDIVLGELEKMAGAFGDVADGISDGAKEVANFANSVMNSASIITMVVKIVIFAIKTMIDAIAQSREQDAIRNQKLQEAYKENIRLLQEYRHELALTDSVSSVFGDNLIKKIQNANVEISALKDKMQEYIDGMNKYNGVLVAKNLFPAGISPNIEIDWTKPVGEWHNSRPDTLMKAATNVLNNYNKAMGTSLSLFDEFGGISYDALQVVKNEFEASDLWNSDLEALLEYSKEYKETIEELKKSVAEISGQWAAELTDNLIESFIATGDAISNADKALKSFGNTFLKTIIQSYLLDKVFNKYQAKFTDILASNTSSADKMKEFDLILQQMQNDLSIERDSINALLEAAKGYGWLDSSDDTLKGSIQGITEETANRLANLINGMYAEMFRQGAVFNNIDLNVMNIYNILSVSNDKYLDYLSQIAGNTYDTANHTQTIVTKMENVLIRMDDVMASSGGTGGSGIKVYLQS